MYVVQISGPGDYWMMREIKQLANVPGAAKVATPGTS